MRPGDLQTGLGRIQFAFDQLQQSWALTREHWRDQNAQAFDDEVMRVIAAELLSAAPVINQTANTFGAAARACEE